jgi:hypothetical protein
LAKDQAKDDRGDEAEDLAQGICHTNLPPPGVIAAEIVEDLQAALEQMRLIAEDLEIPESI